MTGAPCGAGERFEHREKRLLPEFQLLRAFEMERIERRHKGSIRIDPDEIAHPRFGDEPGDLIRRVAVGVDKHAAVPLADVIDKKVEQEGGFAHPRHP